MTRVYQFSNAGGVYVRRRTWRFAWCASGSRRDNTRNAAGSTGRRADRNGYVNRTWIRAAAGGRLGQRVCSPARRYGYA